MAQDKVKNGLGALGQNIREKTKNVSDAVTGAPKKVADGWTHVTQEARLFAALHNDLKLYVTQEVFKETYNAYWARYKNPGDEKLAQDAAERAAQREIRKQQNPNPLEGSKIAAGAGQVGQLAVNVGIKIPLKVGQFAIKWGLPVAATVTLSQLTTGNYRVVNVLNTKDLPANARANFNIESGIPAVMIETGVNGGPRSVVVVAINPGKESKLFLPFPTQPNEAWAPPYVTSTGYADAGNLGGGYLPETGGIIPSQVRAAYYFGNDTNLGIGGQVRVVGPRVLANPASVYALKKPEDGRQIKVGAFAVLNILPQAQLQTFFNVGPARITNSTITNSASGGSASLHSGPPETGWQGVSGTVGNQVSTNVGNLPGGGNYTSNVGMIGVNPGYKPEEFDKTLRQFLGSWMSESPPPVTPKKE